MNLELFGAGGGRKVGLKPESIEDWLGLGEDPTWGESMGKNIEVFASWVMSNPRVSCVCMFTIQSQTQTVIYCI